LINKATKLFNYFLSLNKEYIADIKLGVITDTWDLDGKVLTAGKIKNVSVTKICGILNRFTGKIKQTPPVYSSVKYEGQPSYKFARRGRLIDLEPRIVSIYNLELISLDNDLLTVKVNCSSGTYIRSLAYEIGKLLGCGASMKGLKRVKINDFKLDDSISIEEFLKGDLKKSDLESSPYIISIERLLDRNPSLYIKDKYRCNIINGHPINGEMVKSGGTGKSDLLKKGIFVKIKDSNGDIIAIHEILSERIIPGIKNKKLNLTKSIVIFR
jgi:tRNA pseudouridine55 synthase